LHLAIRHLLGVAASARSVDVESFSSCSGRNDEEERGGGASSGCTLVEGAFTTLSAPAAAAGAESCRVEVLSFVLDELDSERCGDVTSARHVSSQGNGPRSTLRPSVGSGNGNVLFGAVVLLVVATKGDKLGVEVITLASI